MSNYDDARDDARYAKGGKPEDYTDAERQAFDEGLRLRQKDLDDYKEHLNSIFPKHSSSSPKSELRPGEGKYILALIVLAWVISHVGNALGLTDASTVVVLIGLILLYSVIMIAIGVPLAIFAVLKGVFGFFFGVIGFILRIFRK